MKLLGLFIPGIILLLSCNIDDEPKKKLAELYEKFDDKHISHFPSIDTYSLKKYSYLVPVADIDDNKGGYLKVMYSLQQDEFDELESKLSQEAIAINFHSDECNVFIERGSQPPKMEFDMCKEIYPVPIFLEEMDYFNVTDYHSLPNDFQLYILEVAKGNFFQEDYLFDKMIMPLDWKHGLSRGVALSKERMLAIFWIDIW